MTTKKKVKRWKPEVGEVYWTITTTGECYFTYWNNDNYDKRRYKFGNVFQTEKQAAEAAKKVKTLLMGERKL